MYVDNLVTNVDKLRNDILMMKFAYFQDAPQKLWNLTYYLMVFYPKSLELCPKTVLPLEDMVLAAIYIIIPGFYSSISKKCSFSQ